MGFSFTATGNNGSKCDLTLASAKLLLVLKMRLQTILFDCPKPILDALENCNIDTDEDFLFSSSTTALFQKLPPNIITYAELENLRDRVACSLAAGGRSGEEILRESDTRDAAEPQVGNLWKTGVSALDHLLQAVGHGIIEVAGGRSSGKTVHYCWLKLQNVPLSLNVCRVRASFLRSL